MNISVQHGLRALGCGPKKSDTARGGDDTSTMAVGDAEPDDICAEPAAVFPVDPSDAPSFTDYTVSTDAFFNNALQDDSEYELALSENPIKAARNLVNKARASGPRREEFERIVADCIKDGTFESEPGGTQLLRDVDTRWSSTFLILLQFSSDDLLVLLHKLFLKRSLLSFGELGRRLRRAPSVQVFSA